MAKRNTSADRQIRAMAARILAIILAVSCMIPAAGCGSTEKPNAAETQQNTADAGAEQTSAAEKQSDAAAQNSADPQSDAPAQTSHQPGTRCKYSGMTADEILAKLTLEQKICQMIQPAIYNINTDRMAEYDFGSVLSKTDGQYLGASEWKNLIRDYQSAALSSEAGIPFIYGQDDVHGVNYCRGTVLFPHNIGLGAANDEDLMYKIGAATADEAKLAGMLWNFAPCVAVSTDPRWGRTYESYSSEPEIVGNLAVAYVKGLQDNGIAACGKHFFADGAETWGTGENGFMIDRGDANLSDAEAAVLLDVYKRLVDAGALSIMISHGSVGGVKMHENGKYISVLRDEFGFDGLIVSDWESIHNISGSDFTEQMANAINAGIDMLMEPNMYRETFDAVLQGVKSGKISQERIDDAVRHILRFKIETGVMDDPMQEALTTKQTECGSKEYRDLAIKAVEESMVLLKNEKAVLPLKSGISVYVTGPAAENVGAQCGGWTESWNGPVMEIEGLTTLMAGLKECAGEKNITIITDRAKAAEADVTLLFIGEQPYAEWNGDSADISITGSLALPENRNAIEEAKALRRDHGIPTVACIVAGRQVIIREELKDWDAAVMCYLPGSEGKGVANVLTGQAAFTGKLPMPWYGDVSEIGTDKCLFPVGYGLTTDVSGDEATATDVAADEPADEETNAAADEPANDPADNPTNEETKTAADEVTEDVSEIASSKFKGHEYTLFDGPLSWSEAEDYCAEHGGHLASANSAPEQKHLVEFSQKTTHSNIWIGGYLDTNGSWKWTDGTSFRYENWDDQQPDNFENKETCIRFTNKDVQYTEWTAHQGKWNDTANDGDRDAKLEDFAFIMEK